jgi:phosphatidylglycerophosphate synthase
MLDKLKITPNGVSLFGFALLIGFIVYARSAPAIASIFLFSHVVVDGIDGALARYQKRENNAGAFLDIMLDHSGMVAVTIVLVTIGLLNSLWAITYTYLYTILIIFIIIRNSIGKPIKKVFRSKYVLYCTYGLWAFFNLNITTESIILFSALMVPPLYKSYTTLYKHLKEK